MGGRRSTGAALGRPTDRRYQEHRSGGDQRRNFRPLEERDRPYCLVASNPEFLKEGAALEDFTKPDRVVVGVRTRKTAEVLRELYSPFLRTEHPFLVMSPESAEMTKYVANALLSTKISFINEIANFASTWRPTSTTSAAASATIAASASPFCFPASAMAEAAFPRTCGRCGRWPSPRRGAALLSAVDEVNNRQKTVLYQKISRSLRRQAEGQDDRRLGPGVQAAHRRHPRGPGPGADRSPACRGGQAAGPRPRSDGQRPRDYGDRLTYAEHPFDALDGADALAIVTEWKQFLHPDFDEMRKRMKTPLIFDGRNLYKPTQMKAAGFTYHCIGRATVGGQ